jgi:hypothetical protein
MDKNIKQETLAAEEVLSAYKRVTKEEITLGEVNVSKASFKELIEKFNSTKQSSAIVVTYFIIYRIGEKNNDVAGYSLVTFESEDDSSLDEKTRSYYGEVANILIGSYLASYSNTTEENYRASIQPIFKTKTSEAAQILENQLFKGDNSSTSHLTQIKLLNKEKTTLYIILSN